MKLELVLLYLVAFVVSGVIGDVTGNDESDIDVEYSRTIPATTLVSLHVFMTIHNKLHNAGQCQYEVTVCGRGVNDKFLDDCSANDNDGPEVRTDPSLGVLAIGFPNKNQYVFSDTWREAVVVSNGKCTKRMYETVNFETHITSTSVSADKCTSVKHKLGAYLKINKIDLYSTPSNPESSPSNDTPDSITTTVAWMPANPRADLPDYTIFHKRNYHWGECEDQFTVLGKGLNDLFKRPCVNYEYIRKITNDELLVIANLKRYFFIFSYEPSALVVIKDRKCIKKNYKSIEEKTEISSTPLPEADCTNVVHKMSFLLEDNGVVLDQSRLPGASGAAALSPLKIRFRPVRSRAYSSVYSISHKRNYYYGECKDRFRILGKGINDLFQSPCVNYKDIIKITTEKQLVVANLRRYQFLFSYEPSALVLIKHSQCTKRTYETLGEKTKISSTPLTKTECMNVVQKMSALLGDNGVTLNKKKLPKNPGADNVSTPTTRFLPAVGMVSDNEINVIDSKYSKRDKCEHGFTIVGRGLNDFVTLPCSENDDVKKSIDGETLVILDPTSDSGVYTDKWGELIVLHDGKCFRRTYDTANGQTKITSGSINDEECIIVLEKIIEKIENSKGA